MIRDLAEPMILLLESLVNSSSHNIGTLLREKSPSSNVEGVYAISLPDSGEIVYVGRTKTKTVLGRLVDHCRINTPSDLRGMTKRHPSCPQNAKDYEIRWIEINDAIARAQFEIFAISILKPAFNRYV